MTLIFGRTSTGIMVPVLVDSDGVILSGSFAWSGTAWQKQPFIEGYNGIVRQLISDTNLPTGSPTKNFPSVPNNYVYVYESVSVYIISTSVTFVDLAIVNTGTQYNVWEIPAPASGHLYNFGVHLTLNAGENLRIIIYNATAGDDVGAFAVGRYFLTNQ